MRRWVVECQQGLQIELRVIRRRGGGMCGSRAGRGTVQSEVRGTSTTALPLFPLEARTEATDSRRVRVVAGHHERLGARRRTLP